jgi:hypothetical protein
MSGPLCFALLVALAAAAQTEQGVDGQRPAAEQQLARESDAALAPWYSNLDEARREALRTGKPLMLVFR